MRITDYELSHLILRFEQEKDMKVMHAVQNLGALRDLVDARIELARTKESHGILTACKEAMLAIKRVSLHVEGEASKELVAIYRMLQEAVQREESNS